MHELAVTESIVDIVKAQAEEHGATKVTRVDVTIGGLQGLVPDSVQFYFEVLTKDTPLAEARLNITLVPARAICRKCQHEFDLPELDRTCPECNGYGLDIVGGDELMITSIEAK